VTAAIISLIAAISAALISRSVMISNHRQAWINGLREDLASFFTALDVLYFRLAVGGRTQDASGIGAQQKAHCDALLAYRKTLMRLNMNEALHQELENSLTSLRDLDGENVTHTDLTPVVTLARAVLKREWEVTKYGPFTSGIVRLKARSNPGKRPDP
jgi:hypothetical protein